MSNNLIKIRLLRWFLCAAGFTGFSSSTALAGEIKLTAEVDRTVCSVGERITWTVTAEATMSTGEITPPDFEGFDIVMGPSSASSVQIINGRMTQSESLTYVLRARREGRFTIGPAKVVKRKQVVESNSLEITVLSPGSSSNAAPPAIVEPSTPQTQAGRLPPEVFLVARADKESVYRLDMLTVSYQLYLRVDVSNFNIVKFPQATGFWIEDYELPRQPIVTDAVVRGYKYKMAEIRKTALFPTRAGTLTLDPLTADITINRPVSRGRSRSIWDDPFFSPSTRQDVVSLSTEPLSITVLPLPEKGKPPDFKGDVGQFRLTVEYDKRKLIQNDALTIKVAISGAGYIKTIDPPTLTLPPGFERFDPTVDQNSTLANGQLRGKKTFTYLVIPRRVGEFILEPVVFSYFDPSSKSYQTLREGGITLGVEPAEGGAAMGKGSYTQPSEVTILGSDIRYIRQQDEPLVPIRAPAYKSAWFYTALAISPLLFLMGLGLERVIEARFSDPAAVRRRRAPEKMRRAMNEARKKSQMGATAAAVDVAGKGLAELVGAAINEPTAALTTDLIEKHLTEKAFEPGSTKDIVGLLSEADRVRFSGLPLSVDEANRILDRFKTAAAGLEKIL